MRLVFDIETDNLELHLITKIHCICIEDIDTGNTWECSDSDLHRLWNYGDDLKSGIRRLQEATEIIGHNVLGYDIPVIQKFFPDFKPQKVTDTLILAKMFEPDRLQGHSLESYGNTTGIQKVQHEDWSTFSPEMLHRCKTDVQINVKLYRYLMNIKKDYNKWDFAIKLEHQVAKIMTEQAANGWLFDTEKAKKLITKLEQDVVEIDKQLEHLLHKRTVKVAEVKKPFKKDGSYTEQCLKYMYGYGIDKLEFPENDIYGPFSVIAFESINLSSAVQMKELLLSLGWVPTEWNYKKDPKSKKKFLKDEDGNFIKASPRLTEESYDSLPEGLGQTLAIRLKSEHRHNQIVGLVENVRPDGRISAQANPCGANTARMYHKIVVNIPKAEANVFLGTEMRSLFIVPKGKVLVGCDASGLEWRIGAHYLRRKEVTDLVLNGDIHSYIGALACIDNRDLAKKTGYGILYGASGNRVSKILTTDLGEGNRVKNDIINGLPGLAELLKTIEEDCKKRWLLGLDGRKIFIRSNHSALNALFQSAGAIVMKMAMCLAHKEFRKENIIVKQVGCFHDELQIECNREDGEKVAQIAKQSIIKAGQFFKMRCPLDAEAKVGLNWAETH